MLYRNAGGGFGSQSSQLSDIFVDVEGEGGEGGKVERVGMSRYWDATQSQGEVEVEVESEGESEEECPPYCVLSGKCLGHPKCYKEGTRFDGYCFIHARADAMGDYSGNWSDGCDWGLDGDEEAWRAKYGSPNNYKRRRARVIWEEIREGKREKNREGEGQQHLLAWEAAQQQRQLRREQQRQLLPWQQRQLLREQQRRISGPVLVPEWDPQQQMEDYEKLEAVFGWSF